MSERSRRFMSCSALRGVLHGKAVWIVGSDPGLSEYPDDFLDGKVAITLHLAHVKFPRAAYRYSSEYDRSRYLLEKDRAYAELPLIAAYPMYGRTRKQTKELLAHNAEVYFHRMRSYPPYGVRGVISESFTRYKVRRTLRGRARVWGGHGTCLHTCIYMALQAGAAEIHLIGCGHNLSGAQGPEHFSAVEADHHAMRPVYRSFGDPVENAPLIEQTRLLQRICIAEGIPFYWHRAYAPDMSDYISVSDEWMAEQKRRAYRRWPIYKRLYRTFVKAPVHALLNLF